jgi:hypothetical protein
MRLDYFIIRRRRGKCLPPSFTWDLEQVLKLYEGKKCYPFPEWTLKDLQKRIDEKYV